MLSKAERLRLQQLRLRAWAEDRAAPEPKNEATGDGETIESGVAWTLTRDVEMHPGQQAAADRWFEAGGQGTIKVVTGAGKTLCALGIAERLQRERDPELRIAVSSALLWAAKTVAPSGAPAAAPSRALG